MTLEDALMQHAIEALLPLIEYDDVFPVGPSLVAGLDRTFLLRISLHLMHVPGPAFMEYKRLAVRQDLPAITAFLNEHVRDPEALLLAVLAESR